MDFIQYHGQFAFSKPTTTNMLMEITELGLSEIFRMVVDRDLLKSSPLLPVALLSHAVTSGSDKMLRTVFPP